MDSFDWESQMPNSGEGPSNPLSPVDENVAWAPPQYVSLSDLQVTPRDEGAPWSPPVGEFFQRRTPSSHVANASQGSSSSASLAPNLPVGNVGKNGEVSKTDAATKGRGKNKKKDDTFTLDEFWYEPGKDWAKLELSAAEKRRATAKPWTGLECHTCGASLNVSNPHDEETIINEVIKGGSCGVCGCFN